jgi:3-hydroxybutyryl-CoA dehydrogenase
MTSSSAETHQRPVVGVVGAGVMGTGIGQVVLEAGDEVVLHDVDRSALERAEAGIRDGLTRRALKLELDADSIDDWVDGRLTRLELTTELDELGTRSGIVIEAALEDLEVKQAIFRRLDAAAAQDALLASNTSALSIASLAMATSRPGRVLGLHFFNPAALMPLVEVVRPAATDSRAIAAAVAHVERWGKTPIVCGDTPGFVVNRVNRPYTIEALRILEAGLASVQEVDTAMREDGFPMGPFQLIDLAGVDVNLAAAQSIWEGLGRPERLRPSPIQEQLVAAGNLGRKTGLGFYHYDNGRTMGVNPAFDQMVGALAPGAIRSRILAAIDAEAAHAVDEGVATAEDIDRALKLGSGHPIGPFERRRTASSRQDAR